jgi:mRNA-degrading endonuclease RelE of RelBE toxin-antitoxin system
VAAAVIDFVTTAPLDNPHRIGKPLREDFDGIWAARRGTYRVLYRIREEPREVVVLRIDHRRDAYRRLT